MKSLEKISSIEAKVLDRVIVVYPENANHTIFIRLPEEEGKRFYQELIAQERERLGQQIKQKLPLRRQQRFQEYTIPSKIDTIPKGGPYEVGEIQTQDFINLLVDFNQREGLNQTNRNPIAYVNSQFRDF